MTAATQMAGVTNPVTAQTSEASSLKDVLSA